MKTTITALVFLLTFTACGPEDPDPCPEGRTQCEIDSYGSPFNDCAKKCGGADEAPEA